MSNTIHFASGNVGALSNGVRAIGLNPAGGGAMKVRNCILAVGTTGGTTYPQLVDLGTAGTAVDHVLADGGTISGLAAVQTLALAANPVIPSGHYFGVKEGNVGALPTVTIMTFAFDSGR